MKKTILLLFAFMASTGIFAQDFDRYSFYLVSDSIYETKDYTYLERDTVDVYGTIPLTGENQFVQISDKPVLVARYDAKLDTLIYLHAYSAVYSIDPATGEPNYWMGNWNPSKYSKDNNLGWDKAKNKDFPYMYLWWTFENYSAPDEYYAFHIDPGMYRVRLDMGSMIDDDPIILFGKMDDLKPLEDTYLCPVALYYKYTKHITTTSGPSASYGAVRDFLSALYYINHGSSSPKTETYYTWDFYWGRAFDNGTPLERGPFKGYYYWMHLDEVYKNNKAMLLCVPNHGRNICGIKKTDNYDSRFDTNWYDLVPVDEDQYWTITRGATVDDISWYCPDEEPAESMGMLLDVDNMRVCFVPASFFDKHWLAKDYDDVEFYANYFFVNYELEGNESMPLSPGEMNEMIEDYGKLYNDPAGAKKLHDYAFGNVAKGYENMRKVIDWFYLHFNPEGWLPAMDADEIKRRIDEYAQCFNDPTGAKQLREYAFGANGIDNISADGKEILYDLSGRRDTKPSKGFYIRNGKKILVK